MEIDIFPLWHAILRHPAGNTPLPEGEPCMYSYNCDFFVFFRSYIFVRPPFEQNSKVFAEEASPDTVVEVWGRSEQY